MRDFFKPWRRKIGVVTLMVACVLIALNGIVDKPQVTGLAAGEELQPIGAVARLGSLSFKSASPIVDFAVSPSGDFLAIVDDDGRISLLDTKTGVRRFQRELPPRTKLPVFSHDGRYLACVTDGRVHEWQLSTGDERSLKQPPDDRGIEYLTYTSLNVLIGIAPTSSDSPKLRLINLHDGNELGRLPNDTVGRPIQLSSDGKRALTSHPSTLGAYAALWDVETGKQVICSTQRFDEPQLAFTSLGIPVAIASHDEKRRLVDHPPRKNHLSLFNVESSEKIREFVRDREIRCIGISSESDLIALRIFDDDNPTRTELLSIQTLGTGEERFKLVVSRKLLGRAKFSENGRILAVLKPEPHSIAVWNPIDGSRMDSKIEGHALPVQSVAFAPDGHVVASASRDGTLILWDVAGKNPPIFPRDCPVNGRSVAFSPDGELLAASAGGFYGSSGNQVVVCDVKQGKSLYRMPMAYICDSASVAFSSDGRYLATGARTPRGGWLIDVRENIRYHGKIEVWDREELVRFSVTDAKDRIWRYEVPTREFHARGAMSDYDNDVTCLTISPDATILAAAGSDTFGRGELSFWKLPGGDVIRQIKRDDWHVGHVAFAPDGKLVATTSSYQLHESQSFHPQVEERDDFSGDPRRKLIELWNVADGTVAVTLNGHEADVGGIAFSPDGKYLASASLDKTIGIWIVADGRRIASLKGHEGGVLCVAFSPDGKLLASGSADTTILIWDFAKAIKQ